MIFTYYTMHIPTGKIIELEKDFLDRSNFYKTLDDWNRQGGKIWKYSSMKFLEIGQALEKPVQKTETLKNLIRNEINLHLQENAQIDFNADLDGWFDALVDFSQLKNQDKLVGTLKSISHGPPSMANIRRIKIISQFMKNQSPVPFDAIEKMSRNILDNVYKGQFANQYGEHSQASEFLSVLRQALEYNN